MKPLSQAERLNNYSTRVGYLVAADVWAAVLSLINSGTPVEGLRFIAKANEAELRRMAEEVGK